jgi:hypothetical protein
MGKTGCVVNFDTQPAERRRRRRRKDKTKKQEIEMELLQGVSLLGALLAPSGGGGGGGGGGELTDEQGRFQHNEEEEEGEEGRTDMRRAGVERGRGGPQARTVCPPPILLNPKKRVVALFAFLGLISFLMILVNSFAAIIQNDKVMSLMGRWADANDSASAE